MNRALRTFALALLVVPAWFAQPTEAQVVVTGARTVLTNPPTPVGYGKTVIKERRHRRERNPYFAARPVYPPADQGARANVTFEPYTRWYYPNEKSYYPPLSTYPSIRSR